MQQTEASSHQTACRFCRQPIDSSATKCHHCGEKLTTSSFQSQLTRKAMGTIGVITAVLSLFFGLKEGYFFIKERQETRAMADSYLAAAEKFIALDSLVYAERSLEKALSANPSDHRLRAKAFFMRADHFLREADYFGGQFPEDRFAAVQDMVLNGFSLLNANLPKVDQGRLMLTLARLIQYDRQWQSDQGVADLFDQAMHVDSDNHDIHFWYGLWLQNADDPQSRQRGIDLLQQAADSDRNHAMYALAYADALAEKHTYQDAFAVYRRAIESKPSQDQLHRIRAANQAKRNLAHAIISADKQYPISGDEFFGMDQQQRLELTRFAYAHRQHRDLAYIAAKLFHQNGLNEEAEQAIRNALGTYDARSPQDRLQLFSDILTSLGKSDESREVKRLIDLQEEHRKYDDILETSINNGHRYKIGLKIDRRHTDVGLLIVKAYELYPFHKAGIQDGDRIVRFGHRPINNLRDIIDLLTEFSPGVDVPMKVIRGSDEMDLILVVE